MNTLRKTSVAAAIIMGFLFAVVFSIPDDEQIKQFIDSPGVREKSADTKHSKAIRSQKLVPPLVQQVEAFSSYLNPKSELKTILPASKSVNILRQPAVTPKFKLLGTSYCKNNPKMSLALIDEPGKGQRWIRQSSEVDHLRIEQIREGLVIIKSSKETFELTIQSSPEKNKLIRGISPTSAEQLAGPF